LNVEKVVLREEDENTELLNDMTNNIIKDIKMSHMWKLNSDGDECLIVSIDNVLCKMIFINLSEERFDAYQMYLKLINVCNPKTWKSNVMFSVIYIQL